MKVFRDEVHDVSDEVVLCKVFDGGYAFGGECDSVGLCEIDDFDQLGSQTCLENAWACHVSFACFKGVLDHVQVFGCHDCDEGLFVVGEEVGFHGDFEEGHGLARDCGNKNPVCVV